MGNKDNQITQDLCQEAGISTQNARQILDAGSPHI